MVIHPLAPIVSPSSRILILGSFPSVKSRESGFYYGHPQNRFWRVIAAVCSRPVPTTLSEKRSLLLSLDIAVWDVIASCEIKGSADASIDHVTVNDVGALLQKAPIGSIFVNGKTAAFYYDKYLKQALHKEAICLPSTSPANAAWSLERLVEAWRVIADSLQDKREL